MWSSDYPPIVSIWPHSQDVIACDFKGVRDTEKWKIVRENVIALYDLDVD
jgi:hypothetical protein